MCINNPPHISNFCVDLIKQMLARMSLYYKKCKLCNKKKTTSNVHSCTSCEQLWLYFWQMSYGFFHDGLYYGKRHEI
jgi:hypothetical protein